MMHVMNQKWYIVVIVTNGCRVSDFHSTTRRLTKHTPCMFFAHFIQMSHGQIKK
jgi:hypothetical protein